MAYRLNSFTGYEKMPVGLGVLAPGLSAFLRFGLPEAEKHHAIGVYSNISSLNFNILSNNRKEGRISIYGDSVMSAGETLRFEGEAEPEFSERAVKVIGALAPEEFPDFSCRNLFHEEGSQCFSIVSAEECVLPSETDFSGLRFSVDGLEVSPNLWSVARQEFRGLSGDSWQIQDVPVCLTVTDGHYSGKKHGADSRKKMYRDKVAAVCRSGRHVCIQYCHLVL